MKNLSARLARLSDAQRQALQDRLAARRTLSFAPRIPRREGDRTRAPLVEPQRRLWFLTGVTADQAAYHVAGGVILRGDLNPVVLGRCLQDVVARQEALRTGFSLEEDGEPIQRIAPTAALPLREFDLSDLEGTQQTDALRRLATEETRRPFDLSRPPLARVALVRLGRDRHALLCTLHHLVGDAWSLAILIRELGALYGNDRREGISTLSDLPVTFGDYAAWKATAARRAVRAEQASWWRRTLSHLPAPVRLPPDLAGTGKSFGGHFDFVLSPDTTAGLHALCKSVPGATLFAALATGFLAVLHRNTGQGDMAIGCAVSNREATELESVMGCFADALMLRVDASGDPSVGELLRRVSRALTEARGQAEVSLAEAMAEIDAGSRHSIRHVGVMLSFLQLPEVEDQPGGVQFDWMDVDTGATDVDLFLVLREEKGGVRGSLGYNGALYSVGTIQRWVNEFVTGLSAAAANPAERLEALPLGNGTPELRSEFGVTEARSSCRSLTEAIERGAECRPGATALRSGVESVTFGELKVRVDALVSVLRSRGVGPGAVVPICVSCPLDVVIAAIAVLECKAHPSVLNRRDPVAYLIREVRVSGAECLIASEPFEGMGRGPGFPAMIHPRVGLPATSETRCAAAGDVGAKDVGEGEGEEAVVFSEGPQDPGASGNGHSGHWGDPARIGEWIAWANEVHALGEDDVVLHHGFLDRPGALAEVLWGLSHGACVWLARGGDEGAVQLPTIIEAASVSVGILTPGWVARLGSVAAAGASLGRLRLILSGGEPLPLRPAERLAARPGLSVVWQYNPVPGAPAGWSRVRPGDGAGDWVAIGGTDGQARVQVLDARSRPVPPGVIGRMHVIPAPRIDGEGGTNFGVRVATEDRGRCDGRGRIEVVDSQWLRGSRLPAARVEGAIRSLSMVEDAVVMCRDGEEFGRVLVAYVVVRGDVSTSTLEDEVAGVLPERFRPDGWVRISAMPLLPDGRIAWTALLRLPVVDGEALARIPGVLTCGHVSVRPRLHLSELIPGWRPGGGVGVGAGNPSPSSTPASSEVASVSEGGVLELGDDAPETLVDVLERAANSSGDVILLDAAGQERVWSYADLLKEAERVLGGLRSAGVKEGDQVILRLSHNAEFLAGFWACTLGGMVAVPVAGDPDGGGGAATERFAAVWRFLETAWVVTESGAEVPALVALGRERGVPAPRVVALNELRTATPDERRCGGDPDRLAILLATSGSTGRPKCVRQTHRALVARSLATQRVNSYVPGDISFNWMPLDHVGGLVMFHLLDMVNQSRQVHAPTRWILEDILRWLDVVDRHRATVTWAPNFAFALVNEALRGAGSRHWDLQSLRLVLTGGEVIVAATALRFCRALAPHGLSPEKMRPTWGMSETCSGVTFAPEFGAVTREGDRFVGVGGPIPGVSLRITGPDGRVVSEGTEGSLEVSGRVVTEGYHAAPEANAEHRREGGWLRTGDLGFLVGGRLTITGREADRIIVRGINLYSHEVEAVVSRLPGVGAAGAAACALRSAGAQTDGVAIFFETRLTDDDALGELLSRVDEAIGQAFGFSPEILIPLSEGEIPRTGIGKVQRSRLRDRYLTGEFDGLLRRSDRLRGDRNTLPPWFFRQIWRPKRGRDVVTDETIGRWLVFADRGGLADRMVARLGAHRVVVVEAGAAFAQVGERRYRIQPDEAPHYDRVAAALKELGSGMVKVLHCWAYDAARIGEWSDVEAAQVLGVGALVRLVRSLAGARGGPVRMWVASSRAVAVGDEEVHFWKGGVATTVLTLSQELSWLEAQAIDLAGSDVGVDGDCLWDEIRGAGADREVAYREGRRLVPRLEPFIPRPSPGTGIAFREGGHYLITGGLGGIGVEIARFLLREFGADVLLVGRRQPDDVRRRTLTDLALERGRVRYLAADVTDVPQVEKAVAECEACWGKPLDGVLHLAGVYHEESLSESNGAGFRVASRPKLGGAWHLDKLLRARGDGWLVAFGSVAGVFGGGLVGAYAAANRCLQMFCRRSRGASGATRICLNWSAWDQVGLNQGVSPEILDSRGYGRLSTRDAIHSLRAAMAAGVDDLMIGLDPSHSFVRRHLEEPNPQCEEVLLSREPSVADVQIAEWRDRFGAPIPVRQLTADGAGSGPATLMPRTAVESTLAAIWSEVLGCRRVSVLDNFFRLGGHSLLATRVASRIRTELGIEVPLRVLFEVPTIAGLAGRLEGLTRGGPVRLPPLVRRTDSGDWPVSFSQQRLWFLKQLIPDDAFYNVPAAVRIRGGLRVEVLERCVNEIVRRHETLRTTFRNVDGLPVQVVHEPGWVSMRIVDLRTVTGEARETRLRELLEREAKTSFDFVQGPLVRVGLVRLGDHDYLWHLNVHHVVFDGWSIGVFLKELGVLYEAFSAERPSPLPELAVQYADFASWQRTWLVGAVLEEQLTYWRRRLEGIPALRLPVDRPRSPVQTFEGAELPLTIDDALGSRLRELARAEDVSLFMVLLGAFQLLLSKHSGQTDISVGSPIANRRRPELEPMIGFFVNTLVLRTDLGGDPTFRELLGRVRRTTLEAYEHQDLPFEQLVEEIQPDRDLGRNPLIQVVMALQNASTGSIRLPGLEVESVPVPCAGVRFDLEFYLREAEGGTGFEGLMAYNTGLFDPDTAGAFRARFDTLLREVVERPDARCSEYQLVTPLERSQLVRWNATVGTTPRTGTMVDLIAAATRRWPERPAVSDDNFELSYAELDRRGKILAGDLRRRGLRAGSGVGLFLDRSAGAIVGLVGILRAGGHYVPVDPAWPRERVQYVLKDAGVRIVVTTEALAMAMAEDLDCVVVTDAAPIECGLPEWGTESGPAPEDLAYVLYTSGSTGRPKGVAVEHRQLVNYTLAVIERLEITEGESFASFSSLAADLGNTAIFGALCSGGRLEVISAATVADAEKLGDRLTRHPVDVLKSVPTHLSALIQEKGAERFLPRRRLVLGGESCSWALIARIHALSPGCAIYNHYGPTEATVGAIAGRLEVNPRDATDMPALGRPLVNSNAWVVDATMELAPLGVPGELYLGGAGVARGYVGRPDLTAEKFVPDPFSGTAGARLYRTGDLARWRRDGTVEFLGRVDQQVKIRGHRVEPGEVERAIAGHVAVREAVVLARPKANGEAGLAAYVVLDPDRGEALAARLAAEQQQLAGHPVYTLPDGRSIAHLNRSETEYLHREVFGLKAYLRHGVAIQDGDCVFDVGANIGMFTLFAATQAVNLSVLAFEPAPPALEVLKLNLAVHAPGARVFGFGLSDQARQADFVVYPKMSFFSGRFAHPEQERDVVRQYARHQAAGAELSERELESMLAGRFETQTVSVGFRTLSEVIESEGITRIDLLKINVEKSELDVLKGLADRHWPLIRQVVLEVDLVEHLDPIVSLLKRHGLEPVIEQDSAVRGTQLHYVYARRGERRAVMAPSATVPREAGGAVQRHWRKVFDELYSRREPGRDPAFDITGWTSSYTREPFSREEMEEWVEGAAARVLEHAPKEVLELGCGSGLLLRRVAPHCVSYRASDFSASALAGLEEVSRSEPQLRDRVRLENGSALESASAAPAASVDAVLLNSVVQYFPGVAYLLQVLEAAARAVREGGIIFVGDVRSRPTLEAFRAAVAVQRAECGGRADQVRQWTRRQIALEEELVFEPRFFLALGSVIPAISAVEIHLEEGRRHNEMSCFRYDVVLHVGRPPEIGPKPVSVSWRELASVDEMLRYLKGEPASVVHITDVPNARTQVAMRAWSRIQSAAAHATVAELVRGMTVDAPEPSEIRERARALGYRVALDWSRAGSEGEYDAWIWKAPEARPMARRPEGGSSRGDLAGMVTDPRRRLLSASVLPDIRRVLSQELPEYMVPFWMVSVDRIPRLANGKIDRLGLAEWDGLGVAEERGFVPPATESELEMASIWSGLLGFERIGKEDHFFDLGGHSLLATQLLSRIRNAFEVDLPLEAIFRHPTLSALCRSIDTIRWHAGNAGGNSPAFDGAGEREEGEL